MKKNRFYRLASTLILELITRQLSHYAPLSHFALHYATQTNQVKLPDCANVPSI